MPLVSLTRLHLRSPVYFPGFLWNTFASVRRARACEGFLSGAIGYEMPRRLGFWTVTLWRDLDAMKVFRNGGAHLAAMKRLPSWCDESAVLHWEAAELPPWDEAHRRMKDGGELTKLKHPSAMHREGRACTDLVPGGGRRFRPNA
jgi:hypothetical protein